MSSQGFDVPAFRDTGRRVRRPAILGGVWRTGARAAALSFAAVLLAPPASAQLQEFLQPQLAQIQPQEPQELPARELTAAEQAAEAAKQAAELEAIEDFEPATYADVLRDPDNLELNFRFARTQIQIGNIRGAGATLERILLINPSLTQVRLWYAVVLFRLDNLDQAEAEFRSVAASEISADTRAEVDRYLGRIELRRRVTRYTASLTFGSHVDTNRDALPRVGLDATGEERFKQDMDIGFLGIASIRVDHDLGYQERHELFAGLTYYHDEQAFKNSFDIQAFIGEYGGIYRGAFRDHEFIPSFDMIGKVFATRLRLSRETFFHDYGFDLRFERRFGQSILGYAGVRLAEQDFNPIRINKGSQRRNGRQIEGRLGGTYVINPKMRVSGEYRHIDKNAAAQFFAYTRNQFRVSYTYLLGDAQFLLAQLTYQRDRYNIPDGFISALTRRDDKFRARFTYGAPLIDLLGPGTLPATLEAALKDVTFSPSIELLNTHSNITNFAYTNWKLQALLTKTWRF